MPTRTWTFSGRILGTGTTGGVRVVVGEWDTSPLGRFVDVMLEQEGGHRILLAPSPEVAGFVTSTYTFDETRIEAIEIVRPPGGGRVLVLSPSLTLAATLGPRTVLGWLLRGIPRRVSTSPLFSTVSDPLARLLVPGVRTSGSAGQGRREYYGATDLRVVRSVSARLDGVDLGTLTDVHPPTRFGFSSTPRRPCLTEVTTTIVQA